MRLAWALAALAVTAIVTVACQGSDERSSVPPLTVGEFAERYSDLLQRLDEARAARQSEWDEAVESASLDVLAPAASRFEETLQAALLELQDLSPPPEIGDQYEAASDALADYHEAWRRMVLLMDDFGVAEFASLASEIEAAEQAWDEASQSLTEEIEASLRSPGDG